MLSTTQLKARYRQRLWGTKLSLKEWLSTNHILEIKESARRWRDRKRKRTTNA
jgi:hypothetical protein